MSSMDNLSEDRKLDDRRALHDSISQIASIRLQSEILLMSNEADLGAQTRDGLTVIVDLTKNVQDTLTRLLAEADADAGATSGETW